MSCPRNPISPTSVLIARHIEDLFLTVSYDSKSNIDGLYTIEFGARCFYNKPTCLFNTDPETGEVANTVVMTLDVESTNMCPELVMDVDIHGNGLRNVAIR